MCTRLKPDESDTVALPVGTADCTTGAECGSSFCLRDVAGALRCCEGECGISDRVCSTAGQCVCSPQHREVGGLCLLADGQPCRDGNDCASDHCADGVCCDAACEGVCERCDALPEVGKCSLHERDPACVDSTNFVCVAQNRCRLPLSFACGSDADCNSNQCAAGINGQSICCTSQCNGVCQRCDTAGTCSFPPDDPTCPVITECPSQTACLDYRLPPPRACASSGQCAECEALPVRAGIPCGVGAQCNGAGACEITGAGRVAAGSGHTCAVRDDGNVRCWGSNIWGQLGAAFEHPFVGDDEVPSAVQAALEINFDRTVVQITAGFAHTCVLFGEDGGVRCWGSVGDVLAFGSGVGLLGTDDVKYNASGFVDPLTTGDVRLSEPAVQISAANGDVHTCAVLESGKVSCWGSNDHGQCGIGEVSESVGGTSNENLPVLALDPADPEMRALHVSAGGEHSCALLAVGGRVTCWGAGSSGQLGYGQASDRPAPGGSVPIGEPAFQVMAGSNHTCALLDRGRVRCWGRNSYGGLGYGHAITIGDDETPEAALTLPRPRGDQPLGGDAQLGGGGVEQITSIVDAQAVCARFGDGTVRCWGQNDRGQLGYGHTQSDGDLFPPDRLAFRQVGVRPEGGDVPLGGFAVALADGGRCALVRPEGALSSAPLALYCWGTNLDAQLGLPTAFPSGSSIQTPVEMGPVSWE